MKTGGLKAELGLQTEMESHCSWVCRFRGGARKSSPRSSDAQQSGGTGLFLSSWLKVYSWSEGFNFAAWTIAWASFAESSTKRNIRYLETQRQNKSLTITQSYTVTQSDRHNLDRGHCRQYQTFPFKLCLACIHVSTGRCSVVTIN